MQYSIPNKEGVSILSIPLCISFRIHGNGTGHSCCMQKARRNHQIQGVSLSQTRYLIVQYRVSLSIYNIPDNERKKKKAKVQSPFNNRILHQYHVLYSTRALGRSDQLHSMRGPLEGNYILLLINPVWIFIFYFLFFPGALFIISFLECCTAKRACFHCRGSKSDHAKGSILHQIRRQLRLEVTFKDLPFLCFFIRKKKTCSCLDLWNLSFGIECLHHE